MNDYWLIYKNDKHHCRDRHPQLKNRLRLRIHPQNDHRVSSGGGRDPPPLPRRIGLALSPAIPQALRLQLRFLQERRTRRKHLWKKVERRNHQTRFSTLQNQSRTVLQIFRRSHQRSQRRQSPRMRTTPHRTLLPPHLRPLLHQKHHLLVSLRWTQP